MLLNSKPGQIVSREQGKFSLTSTAWREELVATQDAWM